MHDNIMISYKRESLEIADEFYRLLADSGLSPWLDKSHLSPGQPWPAELRRQAMTCDAMVALIDKAYLESAYCRMELFIVRSRNKPVLPVLLEECTAELDLHEETKGLSDVFFARLFRPSLVGLSLTVQQLKARVVQSASSLGRPSRSNPYVYVSYGNARAPEATELADKLEAVTIPSWVATRDCHIGENWRQAQARGLMGASAQLLVLDEEMANAQVLRTELMLGEALGLPLFPIVPQRFEHSDDQRLAEYFARLEKVHHTYKRVSAAQIHRYGDAPFGSITRELRRLVQPRT